MVGVESQKNKHESQLVSILMKHKQRFWFQLRSILFILYILFLQIHQTIYLQGRIRQKFCNATVVYLPPDTITRIPQVINLHASWVLKSTASQCVECSPNRFLQKTNALSVQQNH